MKNKCEMFLNVRLFYYKNAESLSKIVRRYWVIQFVLVYTRHTTRSTVTKTIGIFKSKATSAVRVRSVRLSESTSASKIVKQTLSTLSVLEECSCRQIYTGIR